MSPTRASTLVDGFWTVPGALLAESASELVSKVGVLARRLAISARELVQPI
jgi:hypothetical protein